MLIDQIKNALINYFNYSFHKIFYICGTSCKEGLSKQNCIKYEQRFFVFSTCEYDEASDVLNNLGHIIKPLMCCEEVSCAARSLSLGQKYKLLTDYYKPSIDFPFPCIFH